MLLPFRLTLIPIKLKPQPTSQQRPTSYLRFTSTLGRGETPTTPAQRACTKVHTFSKVNTPSNQKDTIALRWRSANTWQLRNGGGVAFLSSFFLQLLVRKLKEVSLCPPQRKPPDRYRQHPRDPTHQL